MSEMFTTMSISGAGMKAQNERVRVIAQNIANADTAPTKPGDKPYNRQIISFKNVMDKHCKQEGYKVIPVNEGGIESILRIKEVLDSREYVCFQGDRFVEGGATAPVTFMGRKALFPAGPFVVAEKFRAPAVFYYAMRERGRRYRFIFDIPETPDGKTPNAVLESYVRSLEAVVRRYPQQWFNFYRFWS